MHSLKAETLSRYHQLVQDRIDAFRDMISALTEDSRNDARGSAGDKHETALSMMQLEQEKLNHKLREFVEQKSVLDRISNFENHSGKIVLGSLVKANDKYFFISAALPKLTIADKVVFAVSPQSPLGAQFLGKATGEGFQINNTAYFIEAVL